MSKKLLPEIRPGEILLKDFLEPMGLTASQLARDIDEHGNTGSVLAL